ncbi:GntR family transcriptional regulator [Streptomyces albipurpureus]|uniref:GntR family transcriptional regulator n=1 Tax=Streptomyces albipurpureus TaxID=2897419 RepID=A0ABT0UXV6_9ACTN|nr:GntR family transcriptional regulator [Streptomyces sp. CWNU-1]MCM2393081.1 GntR family transcriptional regulator [Streptomyces sp. CWNU-1]
MAKQYERIADRLRQRIRAGELKPGQRLPAETELVKEYRTSLPTLREALGLLLTEGLIDKKHGIGNFVRKPRKLVRRDNARHQWEKDRARLSELERQATGATERDTGLSVSDLVFSASYREVQASEDLAAQLDVPTGTRLLERIFRTNYCDEDTPLNLARSYLVYDMIAANPDLFDSSNEPWPGGTQNQLHTVGIELDRIEERITARPPTVEETEELGLQGGVSVIVLRKTSFDIEGRVVEVSDVTLPGDRTELIFTTALARW